jgi:CRISPR-associated RAMP protein (TIGR02581 family)
MGDYRDFHELKSLIKVTGRFENRTPLRVGVGREAPVESKVDLAVFRVNGRPVIPGSSLKGVMRSYAEMLERSKGNANIHNPWDDKAAEEEERNGSFCIICGIFGNTRLASHLRVYDSTPLDSGGEITFIKPGISIDRDFGSVRQHGLFYEEFVKPNVEWDLRLDIINIRVSLDSPDERGKLLWSLLQDFKSNGIQVGARKTIGAGLIKLKEAKFELFAIKNGRIEPEKSWNL